MSGILGIWNFDGRPVEPAELKRLSATIAHRGRDAEGFHIWREFGFACRLSRITPEAKVEIQPLADSSRGVVVFDGRLDNRDELIDAIGKVQPIARDAPDPALVLGAYRLYGERFAERLNGDFATALFDAETRQLFLARDVIGLRPLYYYSTSALLLFASEIKTLLSHPKVTRAPADDVLADFTFNRLMTANDQGVTFFKHIFSVLPAHVAVVTANNIVTRRYWDFTPSRPERTRSFHDCADGFRHYFDQSVRRRLRSASPVAVSVSGGLDSSAILCAGETIRRADSTRYPALIGASYIAREGSPADERAFLLEIENQYRLSIQRFDDLRSDTMYRSDAAIWHIEAPVLDMQWSGMSAFLTGIRERGARVLLTGHWGDQFLFDDAYLFDLFRRGAWITAWKHAHQYPGWLGVSDPNYFSRRFVTRLIRNLLPEAIVPALRRLRRKLPRHRNLQPWYTESFRERAEGHRVRPSAPAGFSAHGRSLYREARSRYHVLCMEWHNKVGAMHDVDMAFPFLDRDLIAFLMEVPGELQSFKGIPKAILREALHGVLPDAIAQRRGKADSTDLGNEELANHYDDLTACLRGGLTGLMGYVRRDAVAGQLAQMRSQAGGTAEVSRSLCDLVALELWLRTFCEPDKGTSSAAAASVLY